MSEFSIIKQYFENIGKANTDVILGIGDDAALVKTDAVLAVSVDTFVENIHFPESTSAYDVGWKSLAVNLSDMAAMGAVPSWITLALTLPKVDHSWLSEFSRGLSDLASEYDVALIGGDTTRGALSVTIQIAGYIKQGKALRRSDAQTGDAIYVTGYLGDGALGLRSLNQNMNLSSTEKIRVQQKLNRPQPRIDEMLKLRSFVNSAIDISDGLYADLKHILIASEKGAVVQVQDIPVSREYRWCCQGEQAFDLALTGGDDYEICFTVAKEKENSFLDVAKQHNIPVVKIGEITEDKEYQLLTRDGNTYSLASHAYEHFN